MLNLALISRWHVHASGYAKEFAANPEVRITVVWDDDPVRGKEWAEEMGCDFEPDYAKVLARPDVDAICGCTATGLHKEMYIQAARAGKHIFTEKVLAFTKKDAEEIRDAVKKAGIVFTISYPMRTNGTNIFAKELIDSGLLGKVNYLRIRNAHSGLSAGWLPESFLDPVTCGGGAMMDLGAHGMYLSSYLLGKPVRITSMFNKLYDTAVDDNCVSVIEFENKVIAVTETGFVTSSSPFQMEISGTEGTFLVGPGGAKLISNKIEGPAAGCWFTPKIPRGLPSAINQFVASVLHGAPVNFTIDDAVALSELMDGAYRSYNENRMVEFSEL